MADKWETIVKRGKTKPHKNDGRPIAASTHERERKFTANTATKSEVCVQGPGFWLRDNEDVLKDHCLKNGDEVISMTHPKIGISFVVFATAASAAKWECKRVTFRTGPNKEDKGWYQFKTITDRNVIPATVVHSASSENACKFLKWRVYFTVAEQKEKLLCQKHALLDASSPQQDDHQPMFCALGQKVTIRVVLLNNNNATDFCAKSLTLRMFPTTTSTNQDLARYTWDERPPQNHVLRKLDGKMSTSVSLTPQHAVIRKGVFTATLTDHGAVTCWFKLHPANREMLEDGFSEADKSSYDKNPVGVWDNKERCLVAAFPPGRPNPTHIHTNVMTNWENHIGAYDIPDKIQKDVDVSDTSNSNPWVLRESHVERMHTLLYIEEAAQVKLMRRFDLKGAAFKSSKSYRGMVQHEIEVAGLAERRPSIIKNDVIIAWIPGSCDFEYEGYVAEVRQHTILVYFCEDFDKRTKTADRFHVRFQFSRLQFRRMHSALDNTLDKIMWPEHDPELREPDTVRDATEWEKKNNWKQTTDPSQKQAIVDCINLIDCDNPAPFLLRGAFGTGKTRTLCDLAWRSLGYVGELGDRFKPILVCAEANGAADKIIELLDETAPDGSIMKRVFRFNAMHRPQATVRGVVQECSDWDSSLNLYRIPSKPDFIQPKYDIVVTTYSNASVLFGLGLQGEFSMIICDESSQSLEPMVLCALSLADKKTVVVLAGDDMQISPRVHSDVARKRGLGHSITHRLVEHYKNFRAGESRDPLASPYGALLTTGYRSHKHIFTLASHLFYDNKLKCGADQNQVNTFEGWKGLPNKKVPIVFVAVRGQDERQPEGYDPSWFNRYEAQKVVETVTQLVNCYPSQCGEGGEHITCVSSFRLQTAHIRNRLRKNPKHNQVAVGPIESIQGQEKKVIILSTVRTKSEFSRNDAAHTLGFMHSPQRLNTVITRAASLLVIFGDENCLGHDKDWNYLIQWCKQNNAYVPAEELGSESSPIEFTTNSHVSPPTTATTSTTAPAPATAKTTTKPSIQTGNEAPRAKTKAGSEAREIRAPPPRSQSQSQSLPQANAKQKKATRQEAIGPPSSAASVSPARIHLLPTTTNNNNNTTISSAKVEIFTPNDYSNYTSNNNNSNNNINNNNVNINTNTNGGHHTNSLLPPGLGIPKQQYEHASQPLNPRVAQYQLQHVYTHPNGQRAPPAVGQQQQLQQQQQQHQQQHHQQHQQHQQQQQQRQQQPQVHFQPYPFPFTPPPPLVEFDRALFKHTETTIVLASSVASVPYFDVVCAMDSCFIVKVCTFGSTCAYEQCSVGGLGRTGVDVMLSLGETMFDGSWVVKERYTPTNTQVQARTPSLPPPPPQAKLRFLPPLGFSTPIIVAQSGDSIMFGSWCSE